MKKYLLFLTIFCAPLSLSACGKDHIIVPEESGEENKTVVYISPADSNVETTTNESRSRRIDYSYKVKSVWTAQ